MGDFHKITPWSNIAEWQQTSHRLYSGELVLIRSALSTIAVWRMRTNSVLPVAVEITDNIFRGMLAECCPPQPDGLDVVLCDTFTSRLTCGIGIVRFVNYVSEMNQKFSRVLPIHAVVKKCGVPDWIVQIRHSVTHGRLPDIEILRLACQFCTQWLWKHYWSNSVVDVEVPRFPEEKASGNGELAEEMSLQIHQKLCAFEEIQLRRFAFPSGTSHQHKLHKTTVVFRKLLRKQPMEFLHVLCSCGHLILNNDQLKAAEIDYSCGMESLLEDSESVIGSLLQSIWKPVLEIVLQQNLIGKFCHILTDLLTDNYLHPEQASQVLFWLNLVAEADVEEVWNSDTDWADIFRRLSKKNITKIGRLIYKISRLVTDSAEDETSLNALFEIYRGSSAAIGKRHSDVADNEKCGGLLSGNVKVTAVRKEMEWSAGAGVTRTAPADLRGLGDLEKCFELYASPSGQSPLHDTIGESERGKVIVNGLDGREALLGYSDCFDKMKSGESWRYPDNLSCLDWSKIPIGFVPKDEAGQDVPLTLSINLDWLSSKGINSLLSDFGKPPAARLPVPGALKQTGDDVDGSKCVDSHSGVSYSDLSGGRCSGAQKRTNASCIADGDCAAELPEPLPKHPRLAEYDALLSNITVF